MNKLYIALAFYPLTLVSLSAVGQTSGAEGLNTGTTVVTTTNAQGLTSTVSTTTYSNGPTAVSAQAAADKAKADALTSQYQARSAQIAAANAGIPASNATGTVTLQAGAGTEEANALSSVAINSAADRIISRAKPGGNVLIVTGTSMPDFSAWLRFDMKLDLFTREFSEARQEYVKAESMEPHKDLPRSATVVGAAVTSLVKLVQLAATDWTAGGMALSTDDYMLATAIAGRIAGATIYGQSMSAKAYSDLKDRLDQLDHTRQNASQSAKDAASESASLRSDAKKNKAGAAKATAKADAFDKAAARLNAIVAAYDTYVEQLANLPGSSSATPASADTATLSTVLQQKVGYEASQAEGVLLAKVHSASGGFYTKKNLWTSLGSIPFYASGSAVVSFAYIHGATHKYGLLAAVVPYTKISKVPDLVNKDDEAPPK